MNTRLFSVALVLICTCLAATAQKPAQPAGPPPDIYQTAVRKAVKANATWEPVESRNLKLGPMASDGKRLWAVRKFTNTIYVFDSVKKTWTYAGHAKWVVGLAFAKGKLWVATQKNLLWSCDLISGNVTIVPGATESATESAAENPSDNLYKCWKQAGQAENVVAMTSDGERLWSADSDGGLWVRDATEAPETPWRRVGSAKNITAITFGGDTLWATNTSNKLLVREPVLKDGGWKVVGDAYEVTGLAWMEGKLWSVASSVKSNYTDLNGRGCGPVKTTSETSSEWTCPGVQGYNLQIQSDDDRDTVNVITPDGKPHPLNFSKTISKGAFASLGEKAEWRVIFRNGKTVPVALIVRVDVQAVDTGKRTYSLAVSKISDQGICVTDKVDGILKANATVRALADSSANKPCL